MVFVQEGLHAHKIADMSPGSARDIIFFILFILWLSFLIGSSVTAQATRYSPLARDYTG